MTFLDFIQSKLKSRSRLLIEYIDKNNVKSAESILIKKIDINADILTSYGVLINPLCHAVTNGSIEMVQLLLKYGANVGPFLDNRKNPLQLAIIQDNAQLFETLLKADFKQQIDFNLLLLYASELGKTNIINILVKKCSNINFCDAKGETALSKVLARGYSDCVKILLEHGATTKNDKQKTLNKNTLQLFNNDTSNNLIAKNEMATRTSFENAVNKHFSLIFDLNKELNVNKLKQRTKRDKLQYEVSLKENEQAIKVKTLFCKARSGALKSPYNLITEHRRSAFEKKLSIS
ncbi:ankyrin repeat domain-containing protein 29 [Hydra vulgaris]|uniref:ankyrin repeat domain-containing protein 29 n=1 Tax=Hydra vulgaris TaxID=6087 RepID=UPI001F5EFB35|nr:ankyrin repeat domain-containing protein 29-like [Hydra vulgaris]